MYKITSREEFHDGDDTKKWEELALDQVKKYPIDQPGYDSSNTIFGKHLRNNNLNNSSLYALDIGCGTGLCRSLFEDMNYTGIDQNKKMLFFAKQRWPKDQFLFSPINTIIKNYPDLENKFDIVFTCTVLQHNHWETATECLQDISKLVKPNGYFYMLEATYIEKHYPESTREKYKLRPIDPEYLGPVDGGAIYTYKGWENLLKCHGFVIEEYDDDCSYIARRL